MPDFVVSSRYTLDDGVSAAATKIADSVDKAGAAMDNTAAKVTRADKSFATFNKRIDEGANLTAAVARANAAHAAALASLQVQVDKGAVSVVDATEKERRLGVLRDASIATARRSADALASQFTPAMVAAGAQTGVTGRQLQQLQPQLNDLFTTISTGGGVMQAFLQQGGQITPIFGGIRGTLAAVVAAVTPLGLAVIAAGVALTAFGVIAEGEGRRQADLSAALRATRNDYDALAAAGERAARTAAASGPVGLADARSAYQTLSAVPNFSATTAQLTSLIALSADVARGFGEDVPKGAERLAAALANPTAAAKKMVDEGFTGMNAGLLRSIDLMQRSGDITGAQSAILDAYRKRLDGLAKDSLTPLQTALNDVGKAFTSAGANGKSFASEIGDFVRADLTTFLEQIADLLRQAQRLRDWVGSGAKPNTGSGLVDADTGQAPNRSAELLRIAPEIDKAIDRIAEANKIPAVIADLATRVAYQESKGQQFDPRTGGILTSSAGAQGIMQLMPATARGVGVDPANVDQNILGGLRVLVQLSNDPRFKTTSDVLGAYNAGPGKYADVLAGRVPIPAETDKYIRSITGQAPTGMAGVSVGTPLEQYGPGANLRSGYVPATVTAALGSGGGGTLLETQKNAAADIDKYTRALAELREAGTTTGPVVDDLKERIAKARGEFSNAISPVDAVTRAARDSLSPLLAEAGAARTVAEALNQQALAARSAGKEVTTDQATALRVATLAKLSSAFDDVVKATDRQTESNVRLVAGIDTSAPSLIAATNREKALAEARNDYLPGPEREAAVDRYTAALNRQTATTADLASVTKGFDQRDQLAVIQAETEGLGQNEQLRTKEIALLQAKQALLRQGADLNSAASVANLANVAAIQDATAALQRQKTAADELSGFFTTTFDTIGTAITSAFATGEQSAVKFKDLTKSVLTALAAEFIKLAVLNPLKNLFFGKSDATLSSVGGVIGSLFGGTTSIDTSDPASFVVGGAVAGAAGLVYNREGNSSLPSDLDAQDQALTGKTGTLDANGTPSFSTTASAGLSAVKGLDFLSGGKLLSGAKDFVYNAVGFVPGQSIGSWVSNLVGEGVSDAAITAATAADLGTSVGATATESAVSGAASVAGEAAIGTIGAGVNAVLEAIPYIGAAITIITDLATGNLRGAAIVATTTALGAAIGSIIPGIGTAIGAGVGATVGVLIDTFFPAHPLHPYQDTQVDIEGGRIVAGRQVAQIETTDVAAESVNLFSEQLAKYLDTVGLVITNADGMLGHVGQNIVGLEQFDSVDKLFPRLRFANSPGDTSNFGVAKNAVAGREFATVDELNVALLKAAKFADGMDQVGIKLDAVGTDLTNIRIASVSLTGALSGTAEAANDNADPLRVALNHALSGQTFANVDALSAEIDKVNTFVNGTLPGLLNPVLKTTSSITEAVQKTWDDYGVAIVQATSYGLGTGGLEAARAKAIDLIRQSSRDAIDANTMAFGYRVGVAGGGAGAGAAKQIFDLDQSQEAERTAYKKAWTDTYGDLIVTNADYLQHMVALERTQGAERVAAVRAVNDQLAAQLRALADNTTGYLARLQSVRGDGQGAELTTYDVKAAQERTAFVKSFVDFYGDSILASAEFQNQLTLVDQVHYEERLAIQKKYADAATAAADQASAAAAAAAAQQMEQARQNVNGALSSLADYARGLGTSDKSPLSAQDQLDLARNQFNAVAGAAGAGDYNSLTRIQGYADTLLTSSRNVNGSTAGYVSDFQRVTDVLSAIGSVSLDTLTASAQQAIMQTVADQVTDELVRLRQEVSALRAEMRQGAATPSRIAA